MNKDIIRAVVQQNGSLLNQITYEILHEKVFTDSTGWTLAKTTGNIAAIDNVSGSTKLHLKHTTGSSGYSVAYKTGIFTVGDVLRVTLTGVQNVGATPMSVNFNNGAVAAISLPIVSDGTIVFNDIDTSTAGGEYLTIGDSNGTNEEIFIESIKIEKKNQLISNERFDEIFNNSINLVEDVAV